MDGDRLVAVGARLQADALVAVAALGAVDVGDVDLDMGEPLLERRSLARTFSSSRALASASVLIWLSVLIWTNKLGLLAGCGPEE